MNFMQATGSGFTRFADFGGRSSRSEFWWWTLFGIIGGGITIYVDVLIGAGALLSLNSLFWLVLLVPCIAVSIRRLHDVGKSGEWLLMIFIPFFGGLMLISFFITRGDNGGNRFGANPL